jgi:PIN domain nuclease of toxin-antitoxin system
MTRRSIDPIVLDTHAWIWLEEGLESEFTAAARALMAEARSRGALAISATSVMRSTCWL